MSRRKPNAKSNAEFNNVSDLEKAASELENNLTDVNKILLQKIFNGFSCLTKFLEDKEPGIFNTVIRWFRLYLQVQTLIDPENEKLLNFFEKTVPTAITYIIGCLQHKAKEITNYHYSLLEIIEELLQNVKPITLKQFVNLETGTIACLWNPIDHAGDFNTQLKSLQILSVFLKHLDNDRLNEELKTIKWTNLNLFQDKLKTLVQETKLVSRYENTARELLNNFNMNLSQTVLVFSFYCKTLVLGSQYKFYKPLNLDKFWIDINYKPKTVSFKGRFKLNSKSKYDDIIVILRIRNIKLEANNLLIYFNKPGEFSQYSKEFSMISQNLLKMSLDQNEEMRLNENQFVMEYFNKDGNGDAFDMLKDQIPEVLDDNEKNNESQHKTTSGNSKSKVQENVFPKSYNLLIGSSPNNANDDNNKPAANNNDATNCTSELNSPPPVTIWLESPKTSRNNETNLQKHPIKQLRNKRKFFSSHWTEDTESDKDDKKVSKTKTNAKKPRRQKKPAKKQVGKVKPMMDLTVIDTIEIEDDTHKSNGEIVNITNDLCNGAEQSIVSGILTAQQCSKILKNVGDIYNVGDSTYAKPCQSYRSFKTQPIQARPLQNFPDKKASIARGKKNKVDNAKKSSESNKENIDIYSNKENIVPNTSKSVVNINGKNSPQNKKRIISPLLFPSQSSNEAPPMKKTKIDFTTYTAEMEIDLTIDNDHGHDHVKEQRQPLQSKPNNNENNLTNINGSLNSKNNLNDELSDYEEVRICDNPLGNYSTPKLNELNWSNVSTPKPTNTMNVSDIFDSDLDLTQVSTKSNFLMKKYQNEVELNKNSKVNIVEQILNDWQTDLENIPTIVESDEKEEEFNETLNTLPNNIPADNLEENSNTREECVVFQKRYDIDESENSDNDDNFNECIKNPTINFLKNQDPIMNEDFVVMHNLPFHLNQTPNNQHTKWNTPGQNAMMLENVSTKTTTEYQVTPCSVILRQVQVSTKESVLIKDTKYLKNCNNIKAKKNLSGYYNDSPTIDRNPQNPLKGILKNIDKENKISSIDDNNNNTIVLNQNLLNKNYIAFKPTENQNEINSVLLPINQKNVTVLNHKHANYNGNIKTILDSNKNEISNLLISENDNVNNVNLQIPQEISNQNHANEENVITNLDSNQNEISNPVILENDNENIRNLEILQEIPAKTIENGAKNIQVNHDHIYKNNNELQTKATKIQTSEQKNLSLDTNCVANTSLFENNSLTTSIEKITTNQRNSPNNLNFKTFVIENNNSSNTEQIDSNHHNSVNNINLKPKTYSNKRIAQDVIKDKNTHKPPESISSTTLQQFDSSEMNAETETTLPHENPVTNVETDALRSNDELATNKEQRLSQYKNNSFENNENGMHSIVNSSTSSTSSQILNNGQDLFKNEISKIVDEYKAKMQIRLENAERQCLTNTANLYVQKVCEITKSVRQKYAEQEYELNQLRLNIERLATQMEWQYQSFIKKSKEFKNYKEITERVFNALTNLDIQNVITSEYEDLINQLNMDMDEVRHEVWQTYLQKQKQEYLKNINALSKI